MASTSPVATFNTSSGAAASRSSETTRSWSGRIRSPGRGTTRCGCSSAAAARSASCCTRPWTASARVKPAPAATEADQRDCSQWPTWCNSRPTLAAKSSALTRKPYRPARSRPHPAAGACLVPAGVALCQPAASVRRGCVGNPLEGRSGREAQRAAAPGPRGSCGAQPRTDRGKKALEFGFCGPDGAAPGCGEATGRCGVTLRRGANRRLVGSSAGAGFRGTARSG